MGAVEQTPDTRSRGEQIGEQFLTKLDAVQQGAFYSGPVIDYIYEHLPKEAKDPKAKAFAGIAKKVFEKIEELDKDSKTSISNKEASELLPTTKEAVKAEFAELLGIETKGKKKVVKISQKDAVEAIARAYTAYTKLAPVKTDKKPTDKPSA